jgi:hypothetical protein
MTLEDREAATLVTVAKASELLSISQTELR